VPYRIGDQVADDLAEPQRISGDGGIVDYVAI
jgi:hypothetical protein